MSTTTLTAADRRDALGRRLPAGRGRVHHAEGLASPLTLAEAGVLAAWRELLDEADDDELPTPAAVAERASISHGAASKMLSSLRRLGADIPSLRTPPPGSPEVAVTPGEVAAGKFAIRRRALAEMGHREPAEYDEDSARPTLRAICRGYVREHRRMLERWGWTTGPRARREMAA